jgi:hypothetical protein
LYAEVVVNVLFIKYNPVALSLSRCSDVQKLLYRSFISILNSLFSFSVKNLPQNDPSYIKQIDISIPGNNSQLRGTDLQSNQIDQQIEISRGKPTTVKITVTLKSGEILTATKTF